MTEKVVDANAVGIDVKVAVASQFVLVARFFGEVPFARARRPVVRSEVARCRLIATPAIVSPLKVVASFMWW
ncbi:hypothetical protein [Streptomyces sp. SID1121]|uniref:hypothetical protein n=1 Tax=Streptomyces sp. SID1121 TaxID=3425888 RepID=UPI004057298A